MLIRRRTVLCCVLLVGTSWFSYWGVSKADPKPLELGPIVRLSELPGPSLVPAGAVDQKGRLHVVWSDGGLGNFEILYRQVRGKVAGERVRLSETPGLSSGPKVALGPDGTLIAVWHDSTPPRTRLYLRRSEDGGEQFDSTRVITPSTQGAFTPAIAVDIAGQVHIAWADKSPGNMDIFYGRSVDGGQFFAPSVNLSANGGKSLVPAVATDTCNRVYVAWHDNTPGQFEVFLRVSEDGGKTFARTVNVSSSNGLSGAPSLATAGCGTVYVAWPDNTSGNFEVLARRSLDGGKSFTPIVNLSANRAISIRPALVAGSDGTVHLVWVDGEPDRFQVFYRCVVAGLGATSPRLQVSESRGIAGAPALAVGRNGTARIVWTDSDTGPFMVLTREVTGCQVPLK